MKYSIVIPVYNEKENLMVMHKRISEIMIKENDSYEILFVNDGSTDGSLDMIKTLRNSDSNVKVLSLSRNFGHHIAITAGLDNSSGDAIVTIDCDLQDPPEVIPDLIKKWKEGYDVIYAVRTHERGTSLFKRATSNLFQKLLNWLTNINIPLRTGIFGLIDKKVLEYLKSIREQHRFIRGLISWVGFKQTGVEYVREGRFGGATKYKLAKMVLLAIDGITSFSFTPLRIAMHLGFIVSIISLCACIYLVFARTVLHQFLMGWASIMVAILFLGGVQLITLGVIGEYIGRIYDESKKRPLYIIDESIGFEK